MKIQIEVNGRKIDAIVNDEEMRSALSRDVCRSGYSQVGPEERYYYITENGHLACDTSGDPYENEKWECANYYASEDIANANNRADTLMRKLRRFAAECNALVPPCKQDATTDHWSICYYPSGEDSSHYEIQVIGSQDKQNFGEICFRHSEDAEMAIEVFYSELKWYFTEYKGVKV